MGMTTIFGYSIGRRDDGNTNEVFVWVPVTTGSSLAIYIEESEKGGE